MPAREDDFCWCARGRESRRWWQEGAAAPPLLLAEGFDDCRHCEPETGLFIYNGVESETFGIAILHAPWSPSLFARQFELSTEHRDALREEQERRAMKPKTPRHFPIPRLTMTRAQREYDVMAWNGCPRAGDVLESDEGFTSLVTGSSMLTGDEMVYVVALGDKEWLEFPPTLPEGRIVRVWRGTRIVWEERTDNAVEDS